MNTCTSVSIFGSTFTGVATVSASGNQKVSIPTRKQWKEATGCTLAYAKQHYGAFHREQSGKLAGPTAAILANGTMLVRSVSCSPSGTVTCVLIPSNSKTLAVTLPKPKAAPAVDYTKLSTTELMALLAARQAAEAAKDEAAIATALSGI